MNLKIIFAPFLLATMLDYTVTNAMIQTQHVTSCHGLTLQQKQEAFAYNTALLIISIFNSGYKCTLGEAFRTTTQAQIYAHEGLGITHSKHCERLAIDLNLFDKDGKYIFEDCKEYEILGAYWQSLSPYNVWGGAWHHRKDQNHFEAD
jgi:hypothetical protein